MMSLFESFFDIGYLLLVLGLGIRLLLESDVKARRYGVMTVLLGLGDAFHLIPRVISHLSVDGFNKNIALLSWGEFITSITMTIFYVLFYHYYKEASGERNKTKDLWIYILAALRILLLLLPQNRWGTKRDYIFGLIRNVPFVLMGALLIYWTYIHRDKEGLKNTALLIFLSFAFYVPVVVGARFIPALGALMLPKTIAYVALVISGFRYYIRNFDRQSILNCQLAFLCWAL